MFSKKITSNKTIELLVFLFIIFISLSSKSNQENYINNVYKYLDEINEFSSSFLQIQNNDISEGMLFIKENRLRIEYILPTELVFILKKNKAMFYNKELQEVQYFNPKNTAGEFLLNLFNNQKFFSDAQVVTGSGYFYLLKNIYLEDSLSEVEVYFEKSPFQLKKVRIINEAGIISFAIINPNFNPNLNDKIFSLANPILNP